MINAAADAPDAFVHALASLRSAAARSGLRLAEVPGPARVAPYSAALTGSLLATGPAGRGADAEEELADGRFVVLHDPAGQDEWGGTFRVEIGRAHV